MVLDRDILTCPEDEIREIRPLATYLSGKAVFERTRGAAIDMSPWTDEEMGALAEEVVVLSEES